MSEPTVEDCDRYLDKLAGIFARSTKKDQSRILALAARIQNERVACMARLQAEADLIARLTEKPS
jgi:hypothetical protein